jgi:hypothetical protein
MRQIDFEAMRMARGWPTPKLTNTTPTIPLLMTGEERKSGLTNRTDVLLPLLAHGTQQVKRQGALPA